MFINVFFLPVFVHLHLCTQILNLKKNTQVVFLLYYRHIFREARKIMQHNKVWINV